MTENTSQDRSFLHGHTEGGVWDKAGAPTGDDAWGVVDLGHGIHMLEVASGNPGGTLSMLVGDEGSVLIDNGLKKAADVTLATTENLAGGKVDFLISTHLHGDHVGCNANYAARGTTILSHIGTRDALLVDDTFDQAGIPVLTFTDRMSFHLNGITMEVIPFANAHTVSDAIVNYVEANVIHVGDLFFNKIFGYVDIDNGGSFDGFISAQRQVIDMANDDTVLIAGHGPAGNKAEMQVSVDLMLAIRDAMQPLIDQGLSMEEVLKVNPLSPFEKLSWFHITTERMTMITYHLLTEG